MTRLSFHLAHGGNAHTPIDNLTPIPLRTSINTLATGEKVIVLNDGQCKLSLPMSSARRLAESITEAVTK